MSNIVEVHIQARVPWTWVGDLPTIEAAQIGITFLNSALGLTMTQEEDGYEPNEHGGQTSMVSVLIEGQEAVSWKFLSRLVWCLNLQGEVFLAEAKDVQWENEDNQWESIDPEGYQPAPSICIQPYGQRMDDSWSYEVWLSENQHRAENLPEAILLAEQYEKEVR